MEKISEVIEVAQQQLFRLRSQHDELVKRLDELPNVRDQLMADLNACTGGIQVTEGLLKSLTQPQPQPGKPIKRE